MKKNRVRSLVITGDELVALVDARIAYSVFNRSGVIELEGREMNRKAREFVLSLRGFVTTTSSAGDTLLREVDRD